MYNSKEKKATLYRCTRIKKFLGGVCSAAAIALQNISPSYIRLIRYTGGCDRRVSDG